MTLVVLGETKTTVIVYGWIMYAANTTRVFCLLFAAAANAHDPHEPVQALGVSPDYPNDKTVFVATLGELTWGYSDTLRSTDGGVTWTKLPKGMDDV